jgi:hypothetical protein
MSGIIATIALGGFGAGDDLWTEDCVAWASAEDVPVSIIDPKTNTFVKQFVGGAKGDRLRDTFGAIWVVDEVRRQI